MKCCISPRISELILITVSFSCAVAGLPWKLSCVFPKPKNRKEKVTVTTDPQFCVNESPELWCWMNRKFSLCCFIKRIPYITYECSWLLNGSLWREWVLWFMQSTPSLVQMFKLPFIPLLYLDSYFFSSWRPLSRWGDEEHNVPAPTQNTRKTSSCVSCLGSHARSARDKRFAILYDFMHNFSKAKCRRTNVKACLTMWNQAHVANNRVKAFT